MRGKELRLGDQAVSRILGLVDHRAGQQPVHDLNGDEVQHDRAQDLVDVEVRLERSGDGAPGCSPGRSGQKNDWDQHDARQVRQGECRRRARQTTHRELALAADVEDVRPEGNTDPNGDEEQRGSLHRRGAERVAPVEGPDDERVVARDRVGAECQHHDGTEQQRHDERQGQREPAQQEATPVLPGLRERTRSSAHLSRPTAAVTSPPRRWWLGLRSIPLA